MRAGTSAEGRRRPLSRLGDVFASIGDSGPRLALLEGPAGVGKRRIVEAFAERATGAGAIVLAGECRPGEPYAPFAAIVEQALSQLRRTGARGVPIADLACPDGCHPLWFQHQGRRARPRDEAVGRRSLHAAIVTLLETLATTRPTVLAIHGIEDADEESRELLRELLDSLPSVQRDRTVRLMMVASSRTAAGAGTEGPLRTHARSVRIRVDALDEEGLRSLLSSPEYLARLLASTGGLPAALERLIDTAPPSPEEHLARRVARLGAEARACFDALAVLRRPAQLTELAAIAGVDDPARASAELIESGLVHGSSARRRPGTVGAGGEAWRLVVADPDDVERVRNNLPPDWRRTLEARCIDLCLAEPRDAAEALQHALSAGLTDRVVELWDEAAAALEARHADATAASLLSDVERVLGEDAPLALRARLADLLIATGRFGAALRPARAVLAADPADADAARRVANALVLAGELPEAARVLDEARRAAAGREQDANELGATLAELLYQNGRLDEATRLADEVLERDGSADATLAAMQTKAKVALAAGTLDEAERLYRDYEDRARREGHVRHEALAVGGRGVTLLTRGAVTEADRVLRRCARLAEESEDRKGQALAWHNLAVAAHLAHDYATARKRYEEALTLLRLVGNRTSLARAAYNLGELYESLGDRARARAMCDFGAQVGGSGIAPRASAEGLLLRGRIELGDGGVEQARAAFEAALSVLERVDPLRAAAALVGLARVALHEGHVDEAARRLDEVPPGASDARHAQVALTRAELARARGADPVEAAAEAVRAAERAGDEPLLVQALVELAHGQLARGEHPEAMRTTARATEIDARVGNRVPEDLAACWDDRPVRRRLLSLRTAGTGRRAARTDARHASERPALVGDSPAIAEVLSLVERVGPSRCTVLLTGESGTGKERVAEAIHAASSRSDGPLVRVNCAALVENLLVSELFGHEKGAFTGAHERKQGRFELAHGGTLFLDEIGDISPAVQAALLRVLQERSFERVGGRQSIEVDVRIVAATNRDLEQMVRDGTFREDLYYRLNEVRIALPPLREHAEDVPALARHFLSLTAEERGEPPKELSRAAMELLRRHPWPGNVRQLENALRAASLFADGSVLEPAHIAGTLGSVPAGSLPEAGRADGEGLYSRVRNGELSLRDLKKEVERRCIEQALEESEGNISRAAGVLGMKRPRLSQLVKEYGLGGGSSGRRTRGKKAGES